MVLHIHKHSHGLLLKNIVLYFHKISYEKIKTPKRKKDKNLTDHEFLNVEDNLSTLRTEAIFQMQVWAIFDNIP